MCKRKAEPGTITALFRPGKAPVPVLDKPKSLFESDAQCQKVAVKQRGKLVSVYVFYCCEDGTIEGGCHNSCAQKRASFLYFAPDGGTSNSKADYVKFMAAYGAYKKAHAIGDRAECLKQLEILVALRRNFCIHCRDRKLSPAQQACKDYYDSLRRSAAIQNDGCAHAHCPVRGPDVWQVLTADHGTNSKATHKVTNRTTGVVKTKPLCLSDYPKWPKVGGVPAMEVEAEQIEKWICHCCHRLEPTSASGRRCADPATMPEGKRRGTPLETQQYNARRHAKVVYPKQQHVDARKRAIGACAKCKRAVVPGTEPAFEFNHLDEATKCKGGLFRQFGGVGGLVGKNAKAAALDQVRDLLDAEMDKCELLCSNCHHRHTNKYGAEEEEED